MRYNLRTNLRDKAIDREIAQALCAFMNTEGGVLIIGVADDKLALGLEKDFSTLGKRKDKDGFELAFVDITKSMFNPQLTSENFGASFREYHSQEVYVVEVIKSEVPAYCKFEGDVTEFYVRIQNTTRQLLGRDLVEYVIKHFPNYVNSYYSNTGMSVEQSAT